MKLRFLCGLGVAAVLSFSACQSDNARSGANASGKYANWLIPPDKVEAIAKGMTGDEVRSLLGAPERVESYKPAGSEAQLWIYTLSTQTLVHQVSTGMREIPGYDPITNRPTVTREPILANRRVKRYTTLELLMVDNRLVERRPGRYADVNID